MSYHVLHILSHGSYLHKKRNLLVYENKQDGVHKTMPIEDVKAVVIAAKGITLSDALIAALTSYDAIILHCDGKYVPVAWTTPLYRVIDPSTAKNQIELDSKIHEKLWQEILYHKVENQTTVLANLNLEHTYLSKRLANAKKQPLNEAICARYYWRRFLTNLRRRPRRRDPRLKDFVNGALNYGYTVLASLCHRSVIVHGLNPTFGVYHKYRYRSLPLVYDIMEPLRAYIDQIYFEFDRTREADMQDWAKHCVQACHNTSIDHHQGTYKFLEALDIYVSSISRVFATKDIRMLWAPTLPKIK